MENLSGGASRPRKKFDDIFICFDTISACDRQIRCYGIARKKWNARPNSKIMVILVRYSFAVFVQNDLIW